MLSEIESEVLNDDKKILKSGYVMISGIYCFEKSILNSEESWSSKIEEIHEEPTKNGWIDVAERKKVLETIKEILNDLGGDDSKKNILEFGSSAGYMISEIKRSLPANSYIAADMMIDGLLQSVKRNPGITHVQCDCTEAPFKDDSMDFVYALNMMEHISDDIKAIEECFRILKWGGVLPACSTARG